MKTKTRYNFLEEKIWKR